MMQNRIEATIPVIAEILLKATDHDVQHYKTSTLARRIQRRMQVLKIDDPSLYVDRLRSDAGEARTLFQDLLIGVTAFFRDADAFERLSQIVLPEIFASQPPSQSIRIWVPGCATGEEAYTIAMLCREQLDSIDASPDVQIFATDISEHALRVARAGSYPMNIEGKVSSDRLARFFVKRGKRYIVTAGLREMIIFSVHNLIDDPPFSRLDLISCRNVLIYLRSTLQNKLLQRFHYSLWPGGYLFLGSSENISSHGELFRVIDNKFRISQRKGTGMDSNTTPTRRRVVAMGTSQVESPDVAVNLTELRHRLILEEFAPKSVIIDQSGQVLNASSDMQKYLTIGAGDFQNNIIKMAQRGLRVGLRAAMNEALKTNCRAVRDGLSIRVDDHVQMVMLSVQPIAPLQQEKGLLLVVFDDLGLPVSRSESSMDSYCDADSDMSEMIEQMEQELEGVRKDLDQTLQDMEASNEELKSSNEELLSMNEELQSANEELESSKDEIRSSSEAVLRVNDDLKNLLRCSQIATIFLDDLYHIRSFTPAITELYDLIPSDVGRPLSLFVPKTKSMPSLPDRSSIQSGNQIKNTILANSGKSFIRRVFPYQSHSGEIDGVVVTFIDVTELRESEERFRSTFENAAVGIAHVGCDGQWLRVNDRLCEITGYTREQLLIQRFQDITHPEDLDADLHQMEDLLRGDIPNYQLSKRYIRPGGDLVWAQLTVSLIRDHQGQPDYFISFVEDISDRIAVENALRESETLVRTIAENSTEALIMMNDQGYVTYCNQAWLEMTGYDATEIRSQRLHDLVHHHRRDGSDYPISECPIDRALPEDSSVRAHEDLFFRKDGSTFEVLCAASPIFHKGRPISTVLEVRDVSQQKQTQAALIESEQRFRSMADAAPAMLWVTDQDHFCIFLSRRWYETTGQTLEQGLGTGWLDAVHPEDLDQTKSAFFSAVESQRSFEALYRLRQQDGSYRYAIDAGQPRLDDSGALMGYVGSVIDVHERQQAQQSLALSEQRLRLAAESTGFGTYDYDCQKDQSIWSTEIYRFFGFEPGQMPQRSDIHQRIHPKDREHYMQAVQRAMDPNGPGRQEIDFRVVLPSGETRWLFDTGRAFFEEKSNAKVAVRVVGTVQDVTQRKKFEQSLLKARRTAEAANQSRGEFLANMSHEIRTPMTAILGHADILKEHLTDPDNIMAVETIRRNGSFLLEIINDILDLSKIDAGKFDLDNEAVRPDTLVGDIRSLMDVRAREKELPLIIEFVGPIPETIHTDPVRLRQILLNLIGNAIKFTDEGEVRLIVSYLEETNQLRFDVKDTGIGIRKSDLRSLFQPFKQADNSSTRTYGGTGLGLAISQRLAEALGGQVTVDSTYRKGSTFTLTIDLSDENVLLITPNLNLKRDAELIKEYPRIAGTILVVDDRRDIRFLAQHFIEKAGGTVLTATNGKEAVEYLRAAMISDPCAVDLVVMDMQMPVLDGYDAVRQLREHGCTLPIIALTANAMKSDRDKCLEIGCTDYTTKPLDSHHLISMIADLLGHTKTKSA